MVRRYGWHRRGERLVDAAPHGHWHTTTFVAGLRSSSLIAPFVLDGPMTGEAFCAYVEQFLAPALAPGDIVVMDNLGSYEFAGVAEAIAAVGASILYLPPYSPDLNPMAGVRQAESAAPKGRGAHPGGALEHDRAPARRFHPSRVPSLPRKHRLCVHVSKKCSRQARCNLRKGSSSPRA